MSDFSDYTANNPLPPSQNSQPGFLQKYITGPIKNAFSSGVGQIQQGASQIMSGQGNPIVQGTEGALKIGAGIVGAASSPLAPVINPTIGAGVNALGGAIGSNPSLQKFAMSPAGETTAHVAGDLTNAGTIAGGILGAGETADTVGNIWDKVYNSPTNLKNATIARNAAATEGVNNLNQMSEQVGQYKSDLGTNFKAGAQAIEDSNPNLKLKLSSDQMDALQTLKNNKSFSLPNYLKVGATPEDLSGIHSQGSLTPTQAQDLITQLNKSTFTDKASGLGVDQSKIGLTNEIKDAAKQQFGDEWSKVYSTYAKGANTVDSLHDIVNIKSDATPTDINKSLGSILKLHGTPEGKIILQNAVDEFKNTSGIDLTNPTQAIGKILDSEEVLKNAQKPGFLKQTFNPTYLARLGVRVVALSTIGYLLRTEIGGVVKSISGQ